MMRAFVFPIGLIQRRHRHNSVAGCCVPTDRAEIKQLL